MELENAVLAYPGSSSSSSSSSLKTQVGGLNLAIYPAAIATATAAGSSGGGGHALLGRNGSGKSLISNVLASAGKTAKNDGAINRSNEYLQAGHLHIDSSSFTWHSSTVAQVSFESHKELLQRGGTVSKAISRSTGKLNKAAQFLIVRFGLYPFLHRQVATLSTGEIRKVLLVRALAERPRLLILDNAFDGLDVASREMLKDLVSKTILGFRVDILVQAVSAKATAHTKVLLLTHRPEEIVDEIETISQWTNNNCNDDDDDDDNNDATGAGGELLLQTFPRQNQTGEQVLHSALGMSSTTWEEPWNDPTLPTCNEIADIWNLGRQQQQHQQQQPEQDNDDDILVRAIHLTVQRGDATLIDNLDWTIWSGDRWLVAGGNGAGKSSLSRLLANHTNVADVNPNSSLFVNISTTTRNHDDVGLDQHVVEPHSSNDNDNNNNNNNDVKFQLRHRRRSNVGWVSTELHMSMARSRQSVQQVLGRNGQTPTEVALQFAKFLHLIVKDDADDADHVAFMNRPFCELSQGQQKLVLIATALASRPKMLILDEPQQGLDMINRHRVLGLVERVCQATNNSNNKHNSMALVYISHHLEELIPSVDKILHLQQGKAIYNGSREDYDPDALL
jgi:molybdate transport system ATP-binding protein